MESGIDQVSSLEVGPVHDTVTNNGLAAAILVNPRARIETSVHPRQHVLDAAVKQPAPRTELLLTYQVHKYEIAMLIHAQHSVF